MVGGSMSYFDKVYINKYNEIIINAPIQILETAIIKDTVDNTIYLRNIFTNVSSKKVIAIVIEGNLFDITGEKIATEVEFNYTYQDIIIQPNELFGNKIPITLPENTRKIEISIKKVVTDDGKVIDYSDLEKIIPDEPLFINFPQEFIDSIDKNSVNPIIVYPSKKDKYWQCMCGRINWKNEDICGLCNRNISKQISKEEWNSLYNNFLIEKDRKIKEAEQIKRDNEKKEAARKLEEKRLQELQKQEEFRKKEINRKRFKKIAFILCSCCIVIIGLIIVIIKIDYRQKIENANSLKNNHQYYEAISAYNELKGDYSDEIIDCKYEIAESLFKEGKYQEAENAYNEISNYKDSSDKSKECKYQEAIRLDEAGEKIKAADIYLELNDYKDSNNRYILAVIDAGYTSFNIKESYKEKDSFTDSYSEDEKAYRVVQINSDDDTNIGIYVLCIEDGEEIEYGYINISTAHYRVLGDELIGLDSEMYIFSNEEDYKNRIFDNAIIHKSLKCNKRYKNTVSASDNGISITTGFCTKDSVKDNITLKTTFSLRTDESGYDLYGKPFINVEGLKNDEVINLYAILAIGAENYDWAYIDEGLITLSAENSFEIGTFEEDWKQYVIINPYWGGDAKMYVFDDYNSYINHTYNNAIASGYLNWEY